MQRRRLVILVIPAVFLLVACYWYLSQHAAPFAPAWTGFRTSQQERNLTRTLVIARLQEDDTSWVDRLVLEERDLTGAVYTVDNHTAQLTVPTNKGHEVMVYLTYIIDHYDALNDITIFMHAHQTTWHNNNFLDSDSAKTVHRLRSQHVLKNGYMNLRCHQQPGCPDHIHPVVGNEKDDLANIPEAAVIGNSWQQLFPHDPIPRALSQPCCAQFAVSAERIRRIARKQYIEYREWLLSTELPDRLSGRVWEYVWQWLFTGHEEVCPVETSCYCDGYGICFDPEEYRLYFEYRDKAKKLEKEVQELEPMEANSTAREKIDHLQQKIRELHGKMDIIRHSVID